MLLTISYNTSTCTTCILEVYLPEPDAPLPNAPLPDDPELCPEPDEVSLPDAEPDPDDWHEAPSRTAASIVASKRQLEQVPRKLFFLIFPLYGRKLEKGEDKNTRQPTHLFFIHTHFYLYCTTKITLLTHSVTIYIYLFFSSGTALPSPPSPTSLSSPSVVMCASITPPTTYSSG